jgi:hypothetical protein
VRRGAWQIGWRQERRPARSRRRPRDGSSSNSLFGLGHKSTIERRYPFLRWQGTPTTQNVACSASAYGVLVGFQARLQRIASSEIGGAGCASSDGRLRSVLGHFRTWGCAVARSALPSILLQKSFRGSERKFLEPLMRFTRGDARDHIASSKIDHGPP